MHELSDILAATFEPLLLAHLPEAQAREVAQQLAHAADEVLERRLRDSKLEAIAEFAAGAGHEINNPAATIAGRASLLLKSETDPERRRALETIGGQAYRIRDMIGDAMTFARPPEPKLERLQPAQEIRRVWQTFESLFAKQKLQVDWALDETLTLNADREQFRVVMSCLFKNELEALSAGQAVSVRLDRHATKDGQWIRVTISDNGPGLSETAREHLFDPFFSGRSAGRGLGFGLTKCWRILQLHAGQIDVLADDTRAFVIECLWPDRS